MITSDNLVAYLISINDHYVVFVANIQMLGYTM